MKTKSCILMLCLTVLLVAACTANFVRDGYRALTIGYQGYDVALSGMGDLYRDGLIGEDVKNKAIEYGRAYKVAHNEAVRALAAYEERGGTEAKDAYLKASLDASAALARLINYAKPYLVKHGKEVQ